MEDTITPLLVFSERQGMNGLSAVESLLPITKNIDFDDTLTPHLAGAKVLAPVMIFKEGDYVTLRSDGKKVPFRADRARMERWLQNTMRDSAVNYDHNRTTGPNEVGWLRVVSGKTFLKEDPRDGKLALWAQPELGPEALNYVQTGKYRDMSIEIDPETESIVGLGLTNHPKVKNITQFSEIGDPAPAGTDGGNVTTPNPDPNPAPLTKEQLLAALPEELRNMFSELQSAVSTLQADKEAAELARQQAEDARVAAEALAARESARAEFSDWVQNTLILDGEGKTAVPVALKDDIVELMAVFAEQGDGKLMLFSDSDKQISALDLFKQVFSALPRVQLIGEAAPGGIQPTGQDEVQSFGLVDAVKATAPKAPKAKE